jgi:hypothetical protein
MKVLGIYLASPPRFEDILNACSNIYRIFYVLKDLTCDILIGDEVLFKNDVFQTYQASISEEEVEELSEVNTIVWLRCSYHGLWGKLRRHYRTQLLVAHSIKFCKLFIRLI